MSLHLGETAAVSSYDNAEVDTQQKVPVSVSHVIGQEAPSEDARIETDKVDQPLKDVLEEESNVESDTSLRVNGDSEVAPPPPLKEVQKSEGYTPPSNVLSDIRPDTRTQSLSPSNVSGTAIHKRSVTMSKGQNVSVVLITTALETIASSKEAKRSMPLRESTQKAIDLIRSNQAGEHPRDIFEPLRLACETRNEKLIIASLDCISKLISYSFFEDDGTSINALPSPPPSPQPGKGPGPTPTPLPSLVDLVAHTITSCHAETTPDAVSLQIVKALLALVLSHTILVHHSSLLKAVRTVYNIFLLSTDPVNQMVAQGGLTQMVHHIFTRCQRSGIAKWHPETTTTLAEPRSSSSSTRQFFAQAGSDTIPPVLETRDESSSAAASSITPTGLGSDENPQEELVKPTPTLYVCIRYFLR